VKVHKCLNEFELCFANTNKITSVNCSQGIGAMYFIIIIVFPMAITSSKKNFKRSCIIYWKAIFQLLFRQDSFTNNSEVYSEGPCNRP